MRPGDVRDAAQPLGRGGVEPAFALHRFDEDRRGGIEPARRIGEPLFEQVGGVDVGAVIAIVRLVRDMAERHARAAALGGVAGAGERPQCHAVEAVGEGDHHFAARDLARELDRGLDRIRARGPGEHHAMVEPARFQDQLFEGGEKVLLCIGVQVEPVRDAVGGDIIEQRLLQDRVVMPIVERRAARQQVEVAPALVVVHPHAFGPAELARHGAGIAANFGFAALIDRPVRNRAGRLGCRDHVSIPVLRLSWYGRSARCGPDIRWRGRPRNGLRARTARCVPARRPICARGCGTIPTMPDCRR